ncbi:ATP phosphoribosyltransferase regulatory subunit [hydrothermal vent metagenome]|uniref:ATP phosphoribosyltransferase regulatory subunit n=1 Tax=hydrothermal vent metagenome TaxID=652676 RepID=A0A3B1A8J0_9ZZZZ
MTLNNRWVLPEGIEEVLPVQAMQLEELRRNLIDMYTSWGYDLVMPPLVEYLESLLSGTGHDLDLQTFKITDQLTGRMMGIRADMTPQVARIEAHHLKQNTPTRLCYLGTVLHTRPQGFSASRSPLQIGAELYGHNGTQSDVEILSLMVETLKLTGMNTFYIDLGHAGIFRSLVNQAGLSTAQENQLFDVLQRKAKPELVALMVKWKLKKPIADMLTSLPDLNGGEEVFDKATKIFSKADKAVLAAIKNLQEIASQFKDRVVDIKLHYDLSELRGYNYHTGVIFAAYTPGQGQAIAQGGRYDDIGKDFGLARPATGFSADLKTLVSLSGLQGESVYGIFSAEEHEPSLFEFIAGLRAQGERVVMALPEQQGDAAAMQCNRVIVKKGSNWSVKEI